MYQPDNAELATILAALRTYQRAGYGDPAKRPDEIHRIATDDDQQISLDDAGIDRLCEELNTPDAEFLAAYAILSKADGAPKPTGGTIAAAVQTQEVRQELFRKLAERYSVEDPDSLTENFEELPRYVGFELSHDLASDVYAPHAYFADTTEDLAASMSDSDTERDDLAVYDLDTGKAVSAKFAVIIDVSNQWEEELDED